MSEQKRYYTEREGRTLRFGETQRARTIAAFKRFAFVSVAATVMILAFLIPDFVGNYSKSDPTGGWLFLASIALIGILLGGALGISRLERELSLVSKRSSETVALSEVEALELRDGALVMLLGEESQEVPMLSGGPQEELEVVANAIEDLIERERTSHRATTLTLRRAGNQRA